MASRWRPKNRRQILQLEDEGSQSPSIQNTAAICNPPSTPSAPTNKLHALLGHYNSDDESDKEDDSEFHSFMKEIKSAEEPVAAPVPSVWQELWDPQSGQPYYWHTVTNELTWDKPEDFLKPSSAKPTSIGTSTTAKASTLPEDTKIDTKGQKIDLPTATITKVSSSLPVPVVEGPSLPDPQKEQVSKKDEVKVSFKIMPSEKVTKNGPELPQAKTNGRLTIDVDSIIAAIEKEVPPDHKTETFVPLFRRRPLQSNDSRPKLGNDFKSYFRPTHQPVLDLEKDQPSPPAIVNTFKGFGYEEKEKESAPNSGASGNKIKFLAGEILKPLVPVTPIAQLTIAQKIVRIESHLNSSEVDASIPKTQMLAQLEILKEAWNRKKLATDFFEDWLDSTDAKSREVPESSETHQQDQVIDMVLEDSGSEHSGTPVPSESLNHAGVKNDEGTVCLDSALSSFYTDLASLDSATTDSTVIAPNEPSTVSETIPQVIAVPTVDTANPVVEEEVNCEPVKGIKRIKMSSDMTSLVAKWQNIHRANSQ